MLPDSSRLTAEFKPDLLKGVTVVKGKAVALAADAQGKIVKTEQDFTAIPYYAWANRGKGQMMVWLPTREVDARPAPYPTPATTAKITVSGRPQHNPEAIHDGEIPTASNDHNSYFDWYPARGDTESVEYTFEKPSTVSECGLYWFDDTGQGTVRVPASWRLLYKEGADWKPVETSDAFGVEKDRFNKVSFKPVTTTTLRLEVTAQSNVSVGIQKWTVQ